MAQKPLKKVAVLKKPTKYMKHSRKHRDEDSRIRKDIRKKTLERMRLLSDK